jgi:hypothetical protein
VARERIGEGAENLMVSVLNRSHRLLRYEVQHKGCGRLICLPFSHTRLPAVTLAADYETPAFPHGNSNFR